MRRFLNILPVVLLFLIIALAVISWIASVYGADCRNILSSEGIRWAVSAIMDNLRKSPWNYVLIATATLSMVVESGIISGFSKQKYLRQRRAYMLVTLALVGFAILVVLVCLFQKNTLLSAFGTFRNSALQRGLFPLVAFVVYLLALIYAYAIGRFNGVADVIKATVSLLARIADYFITLFFASQLVAVMLYAFYTSFTPDQPLPLSMTCFAGALYGIPLLLHYYLALNNHE